MQDWQQRDGVGRIVPPRLAGHFRLRARLQEIARQVNSMRNEMRNMALEDGGERIMLAEWSALCDAMCAALDRWTPFAACQCLENDETCPICQNMRWVSSTDLVEARFRLGLSLRESFPPEKAVYVKFDPVRGVTWSGDVLRSLLRSLPDAASVLLEHSNQSNFPHSLDTAASDSTWWPLATRS
jgi:hypothetical protein